MAAWRPPLVLKIIAAWEIAGGVGLAGIVLWLTAHGFKLPWLFELVFEGVAAVAIMAGTSLWRGEPPGFFASCILQLLQIVRIFWRGFTFALLLGPSVTLWKLVNAGPRLQLELRSLLSVSVADTPEIGPGYAINFVPIIVLVVLIRYQTMSGQPWLRPIAWRTTWDRARLIGAYQIGAGALGIMNSLSAPDHAFANMLFSIVVILSGAALVRHTRWSDGVAVAVNALQIPTFGATSVTYLLRTGLSCVAAIVWRGETGLHVQFDFGSVINGPLAPGIDGFAGINLTAFALTAILTSDPVRESQPTHGSKIHGHS